MATTKTDAQTQTDPLATQGEAVTGKAQEDVLAQFHEDHQAPEGYAISRDAQGWIVKKL